MSIPSQNIFTKENVNVYAILQFFIVLSYVGFRVFQDLLFFADTDAY